MLNQTEPSQLKSLANMVGSSFATVDVNANDDFVISSCNQLFIDMIGLEAIPSFPVTLGNVFYELDTDEFFYYLEQATEQRCALEFELSFINKSGKQWWLMIITPIIDGDRAIERLLLTGINISEKKQLKDALNIARNRYCSVIQSVHDCIITTDQQTNIVLFNKAAEDIWGYSRHEVIGKKLALLIPEEFRKYHGQQVEEFSGSLIQARKMSSRSVVYGQRKDGTSFPAEISISKMSVEGKIEFTAIVRDISERSRLLEELQHQATTDVLTGLKNRVFLDKQLDKEITRLKHCGVSLSLLMIDIDHFKQVNDTHGHAIGDLVLVEFSKTVSALLTQAQTFARYGGDEFIILLPDVVSDEAYEIAQQIRHACSDNRINDINYTISVGVAEFEREIADADSLIQCADRALYKAKARGRNGVCRYSDQPLIAVAP